MKYPEIEIDLTGEDGNAFSIIGRCSLAMKRAGLSNEIDEFITQAKSADYDNLLRTVMEWFSWK